MKFNKNIIKKLMFFFLILIGLGKTQQILSMELSKKQNVPEVVVDILAGEEDLAKSLYLPSDCSIAALSSITDEQAIKNLKYLSTFSKNVENRSMFSQKDQELFDNAMRLEKRMACCMRWGQMMSYTFVASAGLVSLIGLSDSLTPVQALLGSTLISTAVSSINERLNFYATGTLPDESSRSADDRAYSFDKYKKAYTRLSMAWLDLYFSKDQNKRHVAIGLSHEMNGAFNNLQTRAREKVGYAHADTLLCPLKEVMHYIEKPSEERLGISPTVVNRILLQEHLKFKNKSADEGKIFNELRADKDIEKGPMLTSSQKTANHGGALTNIILHK